MRRYLGPSTKKERLDRDPSNLDTILSIATRILGVRKGGGVATPVAVRLQRQQQSIGVSGRHHGSRAAAIARRRQ